METSGILGGRRSGTSSWPPAETDTRTGPTSGPVPSARLRSMAFGQQSGPPASAKQVQVLVALLADAGHCDFRDARGPMGFTQRQAGGRFTRDEADAFIARLEGAAR